MYWRFAEDIMPEVLKNVSIDKMMVGFPALHTQSPEYTIDMIKTYYLAEKETERG